MTVRTLVDENTPGTALLRSCTCCGNHVGDPHGERCDFVTGRDDLGRKTGLFDARLSDLNPVSRIAMAALAGTGLTAAAVAVIAQTIADRRKARRMRRR